MVSTRVGYTGGTTESPTYGSVCGNDGHTEALRLWYNPDVITYDQLLEHFFAEARAQEVGVSARVH